MTFDPEIIAELQKKLDSSHVKPPQKFGPKGDYLEGWHVIAEANRIFGFDGWSYEVIDTRCVAERPRDIGKEKRDGWGVTYTSRVRVDVKGIVREDFGAGHGYDVDLGLAHESAIKEAVTDALKRTLRTFGNPFGLALYDKSRANVGHADEPSAPKPTSAAEMKRGLEAIEQDLLDCHSLADWKKCVDIWATIMERDNWTRDYRDAARPKFAARKKALTADDNPFTDAQPHVNGDAYRNAKDGKPAANILAGG